MQVNQDEAKRKPAADRSLVTVYDGRDCVGHLYKEPRPGFSSKAIVCSVWRTMIGVAGAPNRPTVSSINLTAACASQPRCFVHPKQRNDAACSVVPGPITARLSQQGCCRSMLRSSFTTMPMILLYVGRVAVGRVVCWYSQSTKQVLLLGHHAPLPRAARHTAAAAASSFSNKPTD
jgi:hypothetical protein